MYFVTAISIVILATFFGHFFKRVNSGWKPRGLVLLPKASLFPLIGLIALICRMKGLVWCRMSLILAWVAGASGPLSLRLAWSP